MSAFDVPVKIVGQQSKEIVRLRGELQAMTEALAALRADLRKRHDAKLEGSKNYLGEIVRAADEKEIERMAKLLIKADYALSSVSKD